MKNIGEILRRRREERKLKPEDIHNDTFISKSYLKALEEGDISVFPAEVYYLGFLKRYATYLKLNPDELVSMYYNSIKQKAETVKSEQKIKRIRDYKPLIFIVLLVVISIVAFAVYTNTSTWLKERDVAAAIEQAAKPEVPATAAIPAPVVKAPLSFEIEAVDNAWIKVVLDEKEVFRGIVPAGTKNRWTARKKITFGVGYASGIKARLNGESVNITKGAKQEVNELTFYATKTSNQ